MGVASTHEDIGLYKDVFEPALIDEIEHKGKLVHLKEGDVLLDIGQTIRQMPLLLVIFQKT